MKRYFLKSMVFAGTLILFSAVLSDTQASEIGFKGIGPRVGYVNPDGLDGTVEFGVALEFGEIVRQLHWDGSLSYWSAGHDYEYYTGNSHNKYNWKLQDIVLRTGVNFHFIEGEWVPYAGGGVGMHFYSWDYNGAPYYSDNDKTEFGIYIDGGIEHEFNESWIGQMQVQFDFADPDQTALLINLIYRLQ